MVKKVRRRLKAGFDPEEGASALLQKELLQRRKYQKKSRNQDSEGTSIMNGLVLLLLLAAGITGFMYAWSELRSSHQEMQTLQRQMDILWPQADRMANFAVESLGARVESSDTHQIVGIRDKMFFWLKTFYNERRAIQGHSKFFPGQCWSFPGDQASMTIVLSHPVSITHVTLGHITKSQSPTGKIDNAPKEFSVHGLRTNEERVDLGSLAYDEEGTPLQTFLLPNADQEVFRRVELRIKNNWGDLKNTCLYGFRVHGRLSEVRE